MASVHRDPRFPKGPWYCHYRLADGRRAFRSTGKKNRREAEIICAGLQEAEDEARGGSLSKERLLAIFNETMIRIGETPIQRIKVKDWLEGCLASKANSISASSYGAYAQAVREFLEFLGTRGAGRPLETITERDIEGFVARLRQQGLSAVTVNKLVRKYLNIPFEKARRTGKIPYNPIAGTSPERTDSTHKATFTGEQIATVLAVADEDWKGAILLAYGTGARLGDVARLRWSNLDVANGVVVFRQQKTREEAVIGLHPDFLDWLATRRVPENPEAPVFSSLAEVRVKGEKGLSNIFIGLLDKAGIEKRLLRTGDQGRGRGVRALSFHSLRHTAASSVFNAAALKEITRRVTQHSAGGVVDRYIHEDLEAIRSAVALIPRLPK
jgi:integrase